MTYILKEIKTASEMIAQFKLIKQLNKELKLADYKRMLTDMLKHNYRMVGVFNKGKCIGISGFWIATKIYSDKYVELDNVVIDEKHRSKGIGKLLCDWIIAEAKRQGCKTAMLDAYVENSSGHRFYFREGFIARGFHFIKKID